MLKAKFYKESLTDQMPDVLMAEFNISEVNISRSMKETTHFKFSIATKDIDVKFQAEFTEIIFCKVEKEGVEVAFGVVGSYYKNDDMIDVECEDVLYLLTQAAAKPHVIYKNRHIVAILRDLITTS